MQHDVTITPALQSLYIGESNICVRNSNLSFAYKALSWSHCKRLYFMDRKARNARDTGFQGFVKGY